MARTTAEARVVENENLAETRAAEAERAEATARAAEADAVESTDVATTREAEARMAEAEAVRQQQIALAQSVEALSSVVVEQQDFDTGFATLLAIEGVRLNAEAGGNVEWLLDDALRTRLTTNYFNNTLRGHEDWVWSVAFSPDGRTLASGSDDQTIRLWIFLEELVEIGCQQVRRNLSWEEWQRYLPGEPYRQTCPNLPPHSSVPPGELP